MPRMLVVDDEQDICKCLQDFFSARGFAVTRAYSGEEALERLSESETDVILLDILLPGLSGIEVLRRAREAYPQARVIMITGLDQADLRSQADHYGAAAYITKPFDFSDATWSVVFQTPSYPDPLTHDP